MKRKSDKKLISFRLSEALILRVKEAAKEDGLTMTAYVERAVRKKLKSAVLD